MARLSSDSSTTLDTKNELELGELNGGYHDGDEREDETLLQENEFKELDELNEPKKEEEPKGRMAAFFWMGVNTVATVLIVFTNKAIFSDKNFKSIQISFAAFHFTVTWLALWVFSTERVAWFERKDASVLQIIPLCIAMSLNVIFPNLSLAFSTVAFYQIARILLTPTVAILDYMLYRVTMPFLAALTLVPACIGVGMVSYYDSRPTQNAKVKTTSELGVIFALTGVFFSSLYTVWIAAYRRKLNMSSMQLLLNQTPISAFLLLYFIPCIDTFPVWTEVPINRWVLIAFSGALAILINISQFFIIAQAGPVASTIVGHSKTCIIVVLGWLSSGRSVGDKAVIGLIIAIVGIIAYSIVMIRENKRKADR